MEMNRDHIAANLSIDPDDVQDVLVSREAWMPGATDVQDVLVSRDDRRDAGGRAMPGAIAEAWMPGATDFEYAPFSQQGGLGKVHQLFGDKLNNIFEELNETLAA